MHTISERLGALGALGGGPRIGTSYFRGRVLAAAARGVPYIIINQGETDQDQHPSVSLRLDGDVGVLFPPAVTAACL